MKCEKCNNTEATFHYSSTVNNHKSEAHLCSDCARQLGYGNLMDFSPMVTTAGTFGGLINEFFGNTRSFMTPFYSFSTQLPGIMPIAEPNPCKTGSCEASPEIANSDCDEFKKRRELSALKYQLDSAVKDENFEKAIELRDKIKELEH